VKKKGYPRRKSNQIYSQYYHIGILEILKESLEDGVNYVNPNLYKRVGIHNRKGKKS